VSVPSLTLVARALWFRRGVSLAVLVVAVVTVAAAAAGPLYLRAGGESVLRDALTAPAPDVTGLDVIVMGGTQDPVLEHALTAVAASGVPRGYPRRILSLQASLKVRGTPAFNDGQTRLMWRDGACEHLLLVVGRCPVGAQDVLVSQRTLQATGRRLGQAFTGCTTAPLGATMCRVSGAEPPLVIRACTRYRDRMRSGSTSRTSTPSRGWVMARTRSIPASSPAPGSTPREPHRS